MIIRKLALLAAMSALGLLAIGGASASASTTIRTDPGGGPLVGSTTITNTTSDLATLSLGSTGGISCTKTTFDADLNAAHSTSSITGTLTALTFTVCTDSIAVVTISSCALSTIPPLPTIHILADVDAGGQVQITDPTVVCSIAGSTTSFCYYTGTSSTAIGTALNSDSSLTYNSVAVHNVAGSGSLGSVCGTVAGSFGVKLTHIVQGGTNRTITITTS